MQAQHLTETRFSDFALSPALLQGLEDLGLEYCTPIQAKSLPLSLKGKDIAGQAQTGTGKTAAFLLATFQSLLKFSEGPPADADPIPPRAIIIAPTRELAIQIHKDACAIGKHTGLRYALVYGGTGYESQRQALSAGVDVIIGTPGRLIDYYKQRIYTLRHVEVVVLDEADRMFDLGFISDIRYLLRRMPDPGQRLNLLFSATLPRRVHELAYEHMNSPAEIEIQPEQVTAERVEETLYHVAVEEKIALLLGLLEKADGARALVFSNTKRAAERVTAYLMGNGYDAALLSGDIPQKKRQQLLERFKAGQVPILVATDVAARGLHIPEVAYVINFDLPQDAEDYVHRIGRTARAGAAGTALSLACDEYVYSLPDIEAFIGHKIPVTAVSEEMLIEPKPPARRERRSHGSGQQTRGKRGHSGPRRSKPNSDAPDARKSRQGSAEREARPAGDAPKSAETEASGAPGKPKRRRARRRRRPASAEATEPS